MNKKILILGAGIMQVPAIKSAKKMGWKVTVADANRGAPGVPLADRFEQVDLKNKEAMALLAACLKAENGLDGVFTAGTDFSTTVAWTAEQNGLPGIPYEAACNASDKARMRSVFEEKGIPSPRFEVVTDAGKETVYPCLGRLGLPVVVKPVDNMGSRGIKKIDSPDTVLQAVETALHNSRSNTAIIEEFISGPEYSLDAVVHNGAVTITGFADRHITFTPYFVEMGHTMPTEEKPGIVAEVVSVFTRAAAGLGITEGAAKGDMKWTQNGPVVGEVAARLSGGYMSGWTYPLSSGVDITAAALCIAVGLPPGDLTPRTDYTSAERAFISIPGVIGSIHGKEEADAVPGVEAVFVLRNPGDDVRFPTNNVEKGGNVISASAGRTEAVEQARRGCAELFFRLEPNRRQTAAFLFGTVPPWAPDAYRLDYRENREAFESMSLYENIDTYVFGDTLLIIRLPRQEEEAGKDWQGRSFAEGLELIKRYTDIRFETKIEKENLYLGKLFWLCFLRGGVQGGLWLIDSLQDAGKRAKPLKKVVTGWLAQN
jgi:biotin carboxylase